MRRPPSPPIRREETHFPHSGAHGNREKKKMYHTVSKYSPKRENTPNRDFNDFTPPPPLPRSPPSYYPPHQSYSPQQSSRRSFNHSSHNNYMHKTSPQHHHQPSSKDFYPAEKKLPVKKSYPSTSAGHNFHYGAGERAGNFQYGAEKSSSFQYGEKAPSYKSQSHRDFDLNNGYNSHTRPKTSPNQKYQGDGFDYNSRYGIDKKSPFRESYQDPPKSKYRDWNPPMLGALPEDFLRVRESSPDYHSKPSGFTEGRGRSNSGSATRGSISDLDDAKIAQLLSCQEFLQELKMNKTFMAEMKKMMKADKKNKVCFYDVPKRFKFYFYAIYLLTM